MKKIATVIVLGASLTMLGACTNQDAGTLGGAAAGAGLGYAATGNAGGALFGAAAGGLLGNVIGQGVDRQNANAYNAGYNTGVYQRQCYNDRYGRRYCR